MGMHLPSFLDVVYALVGVRYPDGDEDACRDQAAQWRKFAHDVQQLEDLVSGARNSSLEGFSSGEYHDHLVDNFKDIPDSVSKLVDQLGSLAGDIDGVAKQIGDTKTAFWIALAALAATIAATAWWTFGVSAAVEVAATRFGLIALVRLAVSRVLGEAATKVIEAIVLRALQGAVMGAIGGVVNDVTKQGLEFATHTHAPGGFNWTEFRKSVESGAIMGAVAGPVMGGAGNIKLTSPLMNGAKEFGASYVANAGGALAAQQIVDGKIDLKGALAQSAAWGAVDGVKGYRHADAGSAPSSHTDTATDTRSASTDESGPVSAVRSDGPQTTSAPQGNGSHSDATASSPEPQPTASKTVTNPDPGTQTTQIGGNGSAGPDAANPAPTPRGNEGGAAPQTPTQTRTEAPPPGNPPSNAPATPRAGVAPSSATAGPHPGTPITHVSDATARPHAESSTPEAIARGDRQGTPTPAGDQNTQRPASAVGEHSERPQSGAVDHSTQAGDHPQSKPSGAGDRSPQVGNEPPRQPISGAEPARAPDHGATGMAESTPSGKLPSGGLAPEPMKAPSDSPMPADRTGTQPEPRSEGQNPPVPNTQDAPAPAPKSASENQVPAARAASDSPPAAAKTASDSPPATQKIPAQPESKGSNARLPGDPDTRAARQSPEPQGGQTPEGHGDTPVRSAGEPAGDQPSGKQPTESTEVRDRDTAEPGDTAAPPAPITPVLGGIEHSGAGGTEHSRAARLTPKTDIAGTSPTPRERPVAPDRLTGHRSPDETPGEPPQEPRAGLSKDSDTGQQVPRSERTVDYAKGTHDRFPDAEVRETDRSVGRNEVRFTDTDGKTAHVKATLREVFDDPARSAGEPTPPTSEDGHQGGHVVDSRFLLDQGGIDVFNQHPGFNDRAFQHMQDEWASWVHEGARVEVNVHLDPPGENPERMVVTYDVFDDGHGNQVYYDHVTFDNGSAGNKLVFDRLSPDEIGQRLQQSDRLASGDLHSTTDPVHSRDLVGDGWFRGKDHLHDIDPHYGEPLPEHWSHRDNPVDPGRMEPRVAELITDPDAPYGRDAAGNAYTQHEYEERFNTPGPEGREWQNFPGNDGAVPRSIAFFDSLEGFGEHYGLQFDRIGADTGKYLGVVENGHPASWEQRAMHVGSLDQPYSSFTAERLPGGWKIEVSEIAPGCGQPGGGLQARFVDHEGNVRTVKDLISDKDPNTGARTDPILKRASVDSPQSHESQPHQNQEPLEARNSGHEVRGEEATGRPQPDAPTKPQGGEDAGQRTEPNDPTKPQDAEAPAGTAEPGEWTTPEQPDPAKNRTGSDEPIERGEPRNRAAEPELRQPDPGAEPPVSTEQRDNPPNGTNEEPGGPDPARAGAPDEVADTTEASRPDQVPQNGEPPSGNGDRTVAADDIGGPESGDPEQGGVESESPVDNANDSVLQAQRDEGVKDTAQETTSSNQPEDQCRDGEPVDLATGEYLLPMVDMELPGVLPLVLRRQHRSGYRYGVWFGPTWASTFDARVVVDEEGVTTIDADGTMLFFEHPGVDEPKHPLHGRNWLLFRTASGGYRLFSEDTGHSYVFEPKEQLNGVDLAVGDIAISAITDRHDNRILFTYSSNGIPVAVEHSGGYRVNVLSDGARITGYDLVDPHGGTDVAVRRFSFEAGNLAAVTDGCGATTSFVYDENDQMVQWRDSIGARYENIFDTQGRVIAQHGADGVWSGTFDYIRGPEGQVTIYTDAYGARTVYELDSDLRPRRVMDPEGRVTSSQFNRWRDPVSVTDPAGATTEYRYTKQGDIAEVIDPLGVVTEFSYAGPHQPALMVRDGGSPVRLTYDSAGNVVSAGSDAATRRYEYHDNGAVAGIVDELGRRTVLEVNAAGLPTVITDAGGFTTIEYDLFGRAVASTDANGARTSLVRDAQGRVLAQVAADGSVQRWEYDGEGNCVAHVDELGTVTRFEYGFYDKLTARIDADGSRTEYRYDKARRLIEVINPQRLVWRYGYYRDGRLQAQTDFNGATTTYRYDRAGRLAAQTNAEGQEIAFGYDLIGRPVTEKTGATTDSASYTDEVTRHRYGRDGELAESANIHGVGSFWTDRQLGLATTTWNGHSVAMSVNAAGQPTAVTTPGGLRTDYSYDSRGVLDAVLTAGHVVDLTADAVGRITDTRIGRTHQQREFDPVGRLITQSWQASAEGQLLFGTGAASAREQLLTAAAYSYRGDGALATVTGNRHSPDAAGHHTAFSLDALGRVTEKTIDGMVSERYGYDATYNLVTAEVATGAPATEPAPPQWQYLGTLLVDDGRSRYSYDRAGRLTQTVTKRLGRKPDVWHYRWDAYDRLREVTTPDGTTWTYGYDPSGRRTHKTNTITGETTVFAWLGDQLLEQTTTGAGSDVAGTAATSTTSWTYTPGALVPLAQTHTTGDGRIDPEHGDERGSVDVPLQINAPNPHDRPEGTPSQTEVDREFFAIVTDQVGTPTHLIDPATATITGHASATLWGQTTWTGTASTPLRFPGQYFDDETGWHYNRFRYYQPHTGRYLTPDPLGLSPAPNPYTYPPNPTTTTDPWGLSPCRNEHLAGQNHPKTGVPFDENGFPDFSEYLYEGPGRNDVIISPTGTRSGDFAAADRVAGFGGPGQPLRPGGYTWHHHQDYGRMQLVDRNAHARTGHTGGFTLW